MEAGATQVAAAGDHVDLCRVVSPLSSPNDATNASAFTFDVLELA
jgi:hypothetical protein